MTLGLATVKICWTVCRWAAEVEVTEDRSVHGRVGVRHALMSWSVARAQSPVKIRSLGVGQVKSC
jgi:hypothetical protein